MKHALLKRNPSKVENSLAEQLFYCEMHELPITQNILEIALRHAEKVGAHQIIKLNITIGQLASIVDDSVQFYWDIVSEGTIAEGATLNFQRLPMKLVCLDCALHYSPPLDELICPNCSSQRFKIISGQEFYLESIEVE